MKQFYLTEITTKDKLVHQGLFFRPSRPGLPAQTGKRAILWIHGLTSTFYGSVSMLEAMADICEWQGLGFAGFNNRGHDLIAGIRKVDKRTAKGYDHVSGGAGYEVFGDSLYDIDAGIDFLREQGFEDVILVGLSSGANKACYWAGLRREDSRVKGIVLVSPVSDRLDTALDKQKLAIDIVRMQELVARGKGDEVLLGYHFFPLTPKRFLSLFSPGSLEDTFDYGDVDPKMTLFSKIHKPLLVIFGAQDEYLDRPVEEVQSVFNKKAQSMQYKSIVVPGGLHSFNGKEDELAETIVAWAVTV